MTHHKWISPFGLAGSIIGLVLLTACSPLVTKGNTANTNEQATLVQEAALSPTPLPTDLPAEARPNTPSSDRTSTSIPPVIPKLVSLKVNGKEVLPGEEAPWYGRGNTITEICLTNVGNALDYQITLLDGTLLYEGRLSLRGEQACAAFDFTKTPTLHPFINGNNDGKVNVTIDGNNIGGINNEVIIRFFDGPEENTEKNVDSGGGGGGGCTDPNGCHSGPE